MKVKIYRDREGWYHACADLKSERAATYGEAIERAIAAGHDIDNAGWLKRMIMWNFNNHAIDGYPGWEIERDRSPAFAKLTHRRGKGEVESHALAAAWDDIAAEPFYQRDWTDDGIPFVRDDETYWSGWWFKTIAERDRFLVWNRTSPPHPARMEKER
jgi:hypothetical protein